MENTLVWVIYTNITGKIQNSDVSPKNRQNLPKLGIFRFSISSFYPFKSVDDLSYRPYASEACM